MEVARPAEGLYPALGMHSLGEEVQLDLHAQWRKEEEDGMMIVDSHEDDWGRLHDVTVTGTVSATPPAANHTHTGRQSNTSKLLQGLWGALQNETLAGGIKFDHLGVRVVNAFLCLTSLYVGIQLGEGGGGIELIHSQAEIEISTNPER